MGLIYGGYGHICDAGRLIVAGITGVIGYGGGALALLGEGTLQTNDWFDIVMSSLFILAVIFIGLPMSTYLIKKGIEGFLRFRFKKLPNGFLYASGLGDYSILVIFNGLLLLVGSLWILFVDRGGQLRNLLAQFQTLF